MSNREIESLLADSRAALTNAKTEPIQGLLAPYGYTVERLDEGLGLVDAAQSAYQTQQTEYAEQYAATDTLQETAAATRATYVRHVQLARVAFDSGSLAYDALGLDGARREDRAGWMAQARQFYTSLQNNAEWLTALAELTVDEAAVTQALSDLDAVESARATQQKEMGEAQQATTQRDDAIATLRGFMRDFYRVAEIALADHPQLQEEIGVVEPS
jgi:hypothetical protein